MSVSGAIATRPERSANAVGSRGARSAVGVLRADGLPDVREREESDAADDPEAVRVRIVSKASGSRKRTWTNLSDDSTSFTPGVLAMVALADPERKALDVHWRGSATASRRRA